MARKDELMNSKQMAFCREYIVDYNATRAAIRSGYSTKTAKQQGSRLLTNVDLQKEIARRESLIENKILVKKDKILRELAMLGFADFGEYVEIDEHGCIRAIALADLPIGSSRAIKKVREKRIIKSTPGTKDRPDGDQILESTFEFELHDKIGPLVQMGKELGMFRERHDIQFDEKILAVFMSVLPPTYAQEFKRQLIAAVEAEKKK